jgi:hypothetical protein
MLSLSWRSPVKSASNKSFPLRAPFSYGFAAATSTSDSPARPPGDSYVWLHSHVCDTSKNALSEQRLLRSSVLQLPRRVQQDWPMRLLRSAFGMRWLRSAAAMKPT